jgi:hypothetical protein
VEAPGTAPGSERLIPMPIYRHSRPCERLAEYRGSEVGREGGRDECSVRREGRRLLGDMADGFGLSAASGSFERLASTIAPREREFAGRRWLECSVFR